MENIKSETNLKPNKISIKMIVFIKKEIIILPIVTLAYAVIHKWTMVIKNRNTIITINTMLSS